MDLSSVLANIDASVFALVAVLMAVIFAVRVVAAHVHGHTQHIWMYISQMIPNWDAPSQERCVSGHCLRLTVGALTLLFTAYYNSMLLQSLIVEQMAEKLIL
jgi:hypothetical protein